MLKQFLNDQHTVNDVEVQFMIKKQALFINIMVTSALYNDLIDDKYINTIRRKQLTIDAGYILVRNWVV